MDAADVATRRWIAQILVAEAVAVTAVMVAEAVEVAASAANQEGIQEATHLTDLEEETTEMLESHQDHTAEVVEDMNQKVNSATEIEGKVNNSKVYL